MWLQTRQRPMVHGNRSVALTVPIAVPARTTGTLSPQADFLRSYTFAQEDVARKAFLEFVAAHGE